jgi:hypothetical protein
MKVQSPGMEAPQRLVEHALGLVVHELDLCS